MLQVHERFRFFKSVVDMLKLTDNLLDDQGLIIAISLRDVRASHTAFCELFGNCIVLHFLQTERQGLLFLFLRPVTTILIQNQNLT